MTQLFMTLIFLSSLTLLSGCGKDTEQIIYIDSTQEHPEPKVKYPIVQNCAWSNYYQCYLCDFCYRNYTITKCTGYIYER